MMCELVFCCYLGVTSAVRTHRRVSATDRAGKWTCCMPISSTTSKIYWTFVEQKWLCDMTLGPLFRRPRKGSGACSSTEAALLPIQHAPVSGFEQPVTARVAQSLLALRLLCPIRFLEFGTDMQACVWPCCLPSGDCICQKLSCDVNMGVHNGRNVVDVLSIRRWNTDHGCRLRHIWTGLLESTKPPRSHSMRRKRGSSLHIRDCRVPPNNSSRSYAPHKHVH